MTNSEQIKEEIKALGLQPGAQNIPNPIPVVETNPKLLRVCDVIRNSTATNATTAGIYTTPTTKDFYLVGVSLSVIKDVTSTSVVSDVRATVAGISSTSSRILSISGISLTPQTDSVAISFPFPIKVDRGTIISVNNSTNVGNIRSDGCIWGYTVEDNQ